MEILLGLRDVSFWSLFLWSSETDQGTAMYARVFYPDGSGDFETSHGLDNKALDLPSEDLDAATRKTIEMVNNGWNPFA
jgi:hypothetical protein